MPMLIRAIAILACVISFASCDRLRERKLIGTWRGEKNGAVDEAAFRPDHTVVWWFCPEELSTPQIVISVGKWHVHGSQLDVDLKYRSSPSEHRTFEIGSISTDTLLLKNTNDVSPVTFHRLETPACVEAKSGASHPIEPNIAGTWQVHFDTYDFKYHFASDHKAAVSARYSGEFIPIRKGTWSIIGNKLIMDLKLDSKYIRDEKVTWVVHEFQPQCFKIKDFYGNSYIVHRLK